MVVSKYYVIVLPLQKIGLFFMKKKKSVASVS